MVRGIKEVNGKQVVIGFEYEQKKKEVIVYINGQKKDSRAIYHLGYKKRELPEILTAKSWAKRYDNEVFDKASWEGSVLWWFHDEGFNFNSQDNKNICLDDYCKELINGV